MQQVDAEQAELQQQADLVHSTLQPLLAEREKLRLLAQAAADESDDLSLRRTSVIALPLFIVRLSECSHRV